MAKYIDVENYCENICRCSKEHCDKAKCPIHNAPAADVAPVKLGKWENNKSDYPACTNCGYMPMYDHSIDDIYYSPYCPNCGAKMDQEVDHGEIG